MPCSAGCGAACARIGEGRDDGPRHRHAPAVPPLVLELRRTVRAALLRVDPVSALLRLGPVRGGAPPLSGHDIGEGAAVSADEKLPFLPLWTTDWLGSTRDLTLAERGILIDLLALSWQIGALPDDPTRLARMCGVTAKVFAKVWPAVSARFDRAPDGLRNGALEEQRSASLRRREAAREGARITNQKRGRLPRESTTRPSPSDTHSATHSESPSDTHSEALSDTDSASHSARFLPLTSQVPSASHSAVGEREREGNGKVCEVGTEHVRSPDVTVLQGTLSREALAAELWRVGVAVLKGAGRSESSARGLIGRWIRDHGETAVAAAIGEGATKADPGAWITAALERRRARNGSDARFAVTLPGDRA